jgi:outer membrane biosynthesis protein TonB
MKLLDPELEHAGLQAIRQWKFAPGQLNGAPADLKVEIEMSFSLRQSPRQ